MQDREKIWRLSLSHTDHACSLMSVEASAAWALPEVCLGWATVGGIHLVSIYSEKRVTDAWSVNWGWFCVCLDIRHLMNYVILWGRHSSIHACELGLRFSVWHQRTGVQRAGGSFSLWVAQTAPQEGTTCLLRGRSSLSSRPFGEPFRGHLLGMLRKEFLHWMPLSLNLLLEPRNTDQNT